MYKDFRFINAGENEIYRYGNKAQWKVAESLNERDGYYSIAVDGGKYWTIGTSKGKYGEFCKLNGTIFSVNPAGYAYALGGTQKAKLFIEAINDMIQKMNEINMARAIKEVEQ